jgi:hypothetical protein
MRDSIFLDISDNFSSFIFIGKGSIRGCCNTFLGANIKIKKNILNPFNSLNSFQKCLEHIENELKNIKNIYFILDSKKKLFGSTRVFSEFCKKINNYPDFNHSFGSNRNITEDKIEGYINTIKLEIINKKIFKSNIDKLKIVMMIAVIYKTMKIFNCNKINFISPDSIAYL